MSSVNCKIIIIINVMDCLLQVLLHYHFYYTSLNFYCTKINNTIQSIFNHLYSKIQSNVHNNIIKYKINPFKF